MPQRPFYLTQSQLNNLSSYKYSSVDRSFLSRYVLNPFWNRPNLITLIGLCFMISAVLVVSLFSSSNLTFLYTYLNMDAIDGKQARRTGTSGPLGELFDHGCDAINMMLMAVLIPAIFDIPLSSPQSMAMCLCGYAAFYASTWEEFHTGTLYLGYFSGPVEGAWSMVVASLLRFLAGGPQIWNQQIVLVNWTVKEVLPVLFISGAIFTILTSLRNVRKSINNYNTIAIEWIVPLIYFLTCSALASRTPSSLTGWFIFISGFPACFRISSTIVAHITKTPQLCTNQFYPLEYVPLTLFLASFFISLPVWSSIYKIATVGCFLVYSTTMLLIITDICNHLNINCLTIKRR